VNEKTRIQWRPIDEVRPYPNNPRNNDDAVEYVANSIREFGWQQPIVVDADGTIIAGHTRLKAAKRLGMDTVPVVVADNLTPAQVNAYRLADNKVAEAATWDMEALAVELEGLEVDFDMTMFDFDASEFDFGGLEGEPTEIVEDEVPEDAPSIVQYGDVWQLGRHRLMCGSATSQKDVQKLLGGSTADLLLTDPPYGVSYVGKTEEEMTIENDSMGDEEFHSFLLDAFNCAVQAMKMGASYYVFHADSRGHVFRSAVMDSGLEIRECLIWVKNSFVLGRQDYHWRHEPCLYGWKGGASHSWYSDRKQSTVLEFDKPNANREHPTMKPVSLFAYLIQNSTKENDLVLDTFGGSGTSLIASEQTNRTCAMMELDPHYCDVIIARWEELTGEKAVKEE
jgi:site-specific DNA-methyltransferase (adenine-specific)